MAHIAHPLFQELITAAHIAVDKFHQEHKDIKVSTPVYLLSGLNARVKGPRTPPPKRSSYPYITLRAFHRALRTVTADASDSPTGPRADKAKKPKSSVRLFLPPNILLVYLFSQVKRSRFSKEKVEDSDEEALPPVQELTAPAPEELPLLPNSPCAFDDNSVSFIPVKSFKVLTS